MHIAVSVWDQIEVATSMRGGNWWPLAYWVHQMKIDNIMSYVEMNNAYIIVQKWSENMHHEKLPVWTNQNTHLVLCDMCVTSYSVFFSTALMIDTKINCWFCFQVCSGIDNEPLKQYKRPLMAFRSDEVVYRLKELRIGLKCVKLNLVSLESKFSLNKISKIL